MPFVTISPMLAVKTISEIGKKMRSLPRKSKFGFLMNSISGFLDRELLGGALAQHPLEQEAAQEE